ncbi:hypothetical protein NDU88_009840 [Pleurodeles waltl]|uniref:Uncharacterized protein n=1 Tax=Pleurodeles waltl TaxID=8319 RepID=A0AAV7QSR5_PLEWA|nr:hypothetical protein NDU88_009840 [Pleurodeles waltl]
MEPLTPLEEEKCLRDPSVVLLLNSFCSLSVLPVATCSATRLVLTLPAFPQRGTRDAACGLLRSSRAACPQPAAPAELPPSILEGPMPPHMNLQEPARRAPLSSLHHAFTFAQWREKTLRSASTESSGARQTVVFWQARAQGDDIFHTMALVFLEWS